MSEQKREFTGVWIPRQVLEDEDLTANEKMLFGDIASFAECFMSNAFLAKRYGCSERTIQDWIKRLKEKGYVVQNGFDGRKRYLQATYISHVRHAESRTSDVPNLAPIDNSIDNNIPGETTVSEVSVLPIEVVKEEKEDERPKPSKKVTPEMAEIFDVFKEVLGKRPRFWTQHVAQRQSAENLFKEKSPEQVRKALLNYVEHQDKPFVPRITNPYDLDRKWSDLYAELLKLE